MVKDLEHEAIEAKKLFLCSLEEIEKSFNRGEKLHLLLYKLLQMTDQFFENFTFETNDMELSEISDRFSAVRICLTIGVFGRKMDTENKSLAIGEFIERLIYFGMPRIAAIEAVSGWLRVSKTTARNANQKYRKKTGSKDEISKRMKLRYSRHKQLIVEYIEKKPIFPLKHPKAKNAFKQCRAYYLSLKL